MTAVPRSIRQTHAARAADALDALFHAVDGGDEDAALRATELLCEALRDAKATELEWDA